LQLPAVVYDRAIADGDSDANQDTETPLHGYIHQHAAGDPHSYAHQYTHRYAHSSGDPHADLHSGATHTHAATCHGYADEIARHAHAESTDPHTISLIPILSGL
jgi:hypothetical protein